MNINPIKTEADYRAALQEAEELMAAEAGSAQGDRLDVMVTLIEAYEARHHGMDMDLELPDPIDAILFRMEQMDLTRKDLEPYIGNRARVSEVLNRQRQLTLNMIRRLHEGLQIPAEVLIQPSGSA